MNLRDETRLWASPLPAAPSGSGRRLSRQEGLELFAEPDLLALGARARERKVAVSGERILTSVNCHINLTNVCAASCRFCGFAGKEGQPGAWVMTEDQVAEQVRVAAAEGVRDFHLVGGLHPTLPLSWFTDIFRLIREEVAGATVKAFTAVEVDHYATRDGRSIEAVLEDLSLAGVSTITGGGAEIFAPEVRRRLTGHNVTFERWAAVHRAAHRIGMRTSATMLYGHIEGAEHRVDHLLRLRELQDETGGFDVFVPLRFQPAGRLADLPAPTAADVLRVFAAARLLLDNFEHVKAFAPMNGLSLAQLATDFGADIIEGTISDYKITDGIDAGEIPEGDEPLGERYHDAYASAAREAGWQPCASGRNHEEGA